MSFTSANIPNQTGRTFVVTGANGGLGFECVLALAKAGGRVVLACRRPDAGEEACARVRSVVPGADLAVVALDVSSLASVKTAADELRSRYERIDVLVNNAGVMAIPHRTTADGFEMQLGTNHFGHFALTAQLFDVLRDRVVNVSSAMHWLGKIDFDDLHGERHYDKWKAYNQSKLANLLFTSELARRLEGLGRSGDRPLLAVAAHPGYSETNLQTAGPKMAQASLTEGFHGLATKLFAQSAASGALPLLYAATMPDVKADDYWGPAKLGVWGAPRRNSRARTARDRDVAKRLWDVTAEQTGVRFAKLS